MDPGSSRVRSHVHHVNPRGDETGENEAISALGGVPKAAAAGVPAGVMELVLQIGHGQAMDHLQSQSWA